MAKPNPLRTYEQLGVQFIGQSGKDDQADCPFCGKARGFHVNAARGVWLCSSSPGRCGRTGNTTTFLAQWHEYCLDETTEEQYAALAIARGGLPPAAFRWWGVAWNALSDEWLIPSYNAKGALQDLRRWGKGHKGLQGVAGCPNNLWGAQVLADPGRQKWPVDVCEGEWDGIALSWLNRVCGHRAVVVAVPGTRTFKEEWWPLFRGRACRWWYDHDEDGEQYSYRSSEKIKALVKSNEFIQWPEVTPDKYDVRDFICEFGLRKGAAKRCFRKLHQMLVPKHWLAEAKEAEDESKQVIVRPATNTSLGETLKVFRRNLIMSQDMEDAFRVVAAVILSNQMPDDPLWLYLVGAPSGGKTELLMSLAKIPDVSYHSSVNAKTMMSGFKSPGTEDPSLIPKLIGKIAVFKDWTEVLASHPNDKNQLDGVMRGAYDGHVRRTWGNGKVAEHEGTFNVLAGVTQMIHSSNDSMMGERFLKFQLKDMTQKSQRRLIDGVFANLELMNSSRNHVLQEAVNDFLNREVKPPYPALEPEVASKMNSLARFVALLRAKPPWERDGAEKFLQYEASPEVGVRLAKQFRKLGVALAIVEGRKTVDMECFRLVHRVGMDTAIGWPQKVLSALLSNGPSLTKDLCRECRMSESFMRKVLRDMEAIGSATYKEIPNPDSTFGKKPQQWRATRVIQQLAEEVEFDADAGQETRAIVAVGT